MRYRIGLTLLVLLIGLSACRSLGAQQSPYSPFYCDEYNGVCVTIKAEKEFVELGEAIPITITVTSEQDFSGLLLVVNVEFGGKALFPGENVADEQGSQLIVFDVEKDQPRIFRGTASFSSNGGSHVQVYVFNGPNGPEMHVTNYFMISFSEEGGQVYYAGTKIPTRVVTDIVLENYPVLTYTPGPSPTWMPSATWPPRIATREALTQQAGQKTPQP